jgi:predicted phosphodiesterase
MTSFLTAAQRVAVVADLHGHAEMLRRALVLCSAEAVDSVVFLGDVIDRYDQADACVAALYGWQAGGVHGNHERDIVMALGQGLDLGLTPATTRFLMGLRDRLIVEDVCFVHEPAPEGQDDPVTRFFSRANPLDRWPYRLVFAGHTHYRTVLTPHGPLDTNSHIYLDPQRRFLINPGPLVNGQFGIWDRAVGMVYFRHV